MYHPYNIALDVILADGTLKMEKAFFWGGGLPIASCPRTRYKDEEEDGVYKLYFDLV